MFHSLYQEMSKNRPTYVGKQVMNVNKTLNLKVIHCVQIFFLRPLISLENIVGSAVFQEDPVSICILEAVWAKNIPLVSLPLTNKECLQHCLSKIVPEPSSRPDRAGVLGERKQASGVNVCQLQCILLPGFFYCLILHHNLRFPVFATCFPWNILPPHDLLIISTS